MQNLIERLDKLHRFLLNQTIYPILLSTIFALGLFSARVILSYSFAYSNLIWNLFLAWMPFLFSIWAAALYSARPGRWWVIVFPGFLWLLFFPNAPYLITDFLHLKQRPGIPIWFDILMLAAFAWTGFFLAIASLRTMHLLVKNHLGWFISWIFAGTALALAGIGIYLGRFSRWNSWDIFFSPKEILVDVAYRVVNPLSNLNFYGFTSIITAFLIICYIMFISMRRDTKFGS
ncbi:MAG TPA: DUF1361 domain-containing protein [Anaerolineales bacterium]|jgi:uncharacterized membrane protein|nr:DUF1361 domain-containing protein [Anaerolineales bacterium]